MAIRRYARTSLLKGGKHYATPRGCTVIRKGVERGMVETMEYISAEYERLDHLAGKFYGNGALWWVIAAASGIGWGLQVPPGTLILIPKRLNQINALIG